MNFDTGRQLLLAVWEAWDRKMTKGTVRIQSTHLDAVSNMRETIVDWITLADRDQ
jgi:hypothetical protein